jgi:hypothetical protein
MLMPVSTNNAHRQSRARTLDDAGRIHTETN